KGYITPEGIRVEIVAEEPVVVNPVGMLFNDDGQLFVLEWKPSPGDEWRETPVEFKYKDGSKRNVVTMKKRVKDVLKILDFKPRPEVDVQSRIILDDELPSSILLHERWLYLSGRGNVRRWRVDQLTGSLGPTKVPTPNIIAQGFCGFHHHQVSGMTI